MWARAEGTGTFPKCKVGPVLARYKKKVRIDQGFNSILTLNITKYLTLA
jgi:hypothetical protein